MIETVILLASVAVAWMIVLDSIMPRDRSIPWADEEQVHDAWYKRWREGK